MKKDMPGSEYVITRSTKNDWLVEGGNYLYGVISIGFLL
jgi:hypothetical protein